MIDTFRDLHIVISQKKDFVVNHTPYKFLCGKIWYKDRVQPITLTKIIITVSISFIYYNYSHAKENKL